MTRSICGECGGYGDVNSLTLLCGKCEAARTDGCRATMGLPLNRHVITRDDIERKTVFLRRDKIPAIIVKTMNSCPETFMAALLGGSGHHWRVTENGEHFDGNNAESFADLVERIEPDAKQPEAVNHPAHYNVGGIEVIDAIKAWGLDFCLGNAVKYIARCEHKGKTREDLAKAKWYIDYYLDQCVAPK